VDLTPLPATGIDLPFFKKRPVFIRDAPSFEPIHFKPRFPPQQQQLAKPEQFNPRLVYDCSFGGGSQAPSNPNSNLNAKYFDKLPTFY